MSDLRKEMMEFITHENDYVHEAAERVLQLAEFLQTEQITEDEFNELAGDVLDMERASKASKNVEIQAMVETGMRALIAFLPKIVGMATGK